MGSCTICKRRWKTISCTSDAFNFSKYVLRQVHVGLGHIGTVRTYQSLKWLHKDHNIHTMSYK